MIVVTLRCTDHSKLYQLATALGQTIGGQTAYELLDQIKILTWILGKRNNKKSYIPHLVLASDCNMESALDYQAEWEMEKHYQEDHLALSLVDFQTWRVKDCKNQ